MRPTRAERLESVWLADKIRGTVAWWLNYRLTMQRGIRQETVHSVER
jgi:hypothetical protein